MQNKLAYRCNRTKTTELQRQVKELVDRRYVRESMSPCSIPTLLVPKTDGSWRMCVGSMAINDIAAKYRYPIPRLDDMVDAIKSILEWKTVFKTNKDSMNGLLCHLDCLMPQAPS